MDWNSLKTLVESAWENRGLLNDQSTREAIAQVMQALDQGALRVAEPMAGGQWQVNEWVKQAVLLNFPIQEMKLSLIHI